MTNNVVKTSIIRHVYVITYMLTELEKSQTLEQQQPQIMETKKVIFRNCAPFTNFISEINKTQVHDADDIDVVMLMHNLL